MPIVYHGFGNILTTKAQTITCPVNTVGVMGAGLARAMRNRIQGLYSFYKSACESGELEIGNCVIYPIPSSEQKVLLFPSKSHWKEDSVLENIEESLRYLSEVYKTLGITELAMIPVGCGLGQLDYTTEVKPLLYRYLDTMEIPVYILHRENEDV